MHQYWFINCVKVPQKHTMLITGETGCGVQENSGLYLPKFCKSNTSRIKFFFFLKQASVFKVNRINMWGSCLSSVLHQTLDLILILGNHIKLLFAGVIFLIPQLLLYSFPNFYLFWSKQFLAIGLKGYQNSFCSLSRSKFMEPQSELKHRLLYNSSPSRLPKNPRRNIQCSASWEQRNKISKGFNNPRGVGNVYINPSFLPCKAAVKWLQVKCYAHPKPEVTWPKP